MKRLIYTLLAVLTVAVNLSAADVDVLKPIRLDIPEMKAGLGASPVLTFAPRVDTVGTFMENTWKPDFDFFKSKTNSGVKPYKFIDDMTFVGVPLFLSGIAIKGEKSNFRQDYNNTHANTRLLSNFKTKIDDYTQFFGPAMTVGLKLGGYEGRSDWPRLLASSMMSYGIMAAFVNGIKYTASEMRPDGSTANSWPSGHTATSFVGATILHKEYGLTRSPWFSVAGYGVATATGVMRILNNRHWISDVMSGAGIGILSTELGYGLGDLLFKERGLLRNDAQDFSDDPSFFAISMGVGFGLKSLSFDTNDYEVLEDANITPDPPITINFHTASVVDAEGAYFFNKYVGIGGRLRVRAMTAKGWSDFMQNSYDEAEAMNALIGLMRYGFSDGTISETEMNALEAVTETHEVTIESDHLTEFYANVGLYLNFPLSKHFALGTKLLIGRAMTQELDINSKMTGHTANIDYTMKIDNGKVDNDHTSIKQIAGGVPYETEWDYLTLGGNNSTTYGTGLSLTYKYKSNFAWKIFADYDFSKRTYTLTHDPWRYLKTAMPGIDHFFDVYDFDTDATRYKKKKNVGLFTIGGSFLVNF